MRTPAPRVFRWHLGHCHPALLPTRRGFGAGFRGFYGCCADYYRHCTQVCGALRHVLYSKMYRAFPELFFCLFSPDRCKYDFWNGENLDYSVNGSYSAVREKKSVKWFWSSIFETNSITLIQELFSRLANSLLEEHMKSSSSSPFFLYLSLQSIHDPFQVPLRHLKWYDWLKPFDLVGESPRIRRATLGMATAMDLALGDVLRKLRALDLMDDTIVIFTSDVCTLNLLFSNRFSTNTLHTK